MVDIHLKARFLLQTILDIPNWRFASQRIFGYVLSQEHQFCFANKRLSHLKEGLR